MAVDIPAEMPSLIRIDRHTRIDISEPVAGKGLALQVSVLLRSGYTPELRIYQTGYSTEDDGCFKTHLSKNVLRAIGQAVEKW